MNKNLRTLWVGVVACSLVLSVLACGAGPATVSPTMQPSLAPTNTVPPTNTPVPLIHSVTLVSVASQETSQKPAYTLKAQTPQLQGSSDPRVVQFNNEMTQITQEEIARFKDNARVAVIIPGAGGSGYDQQYKVYGPVGNLIGIKFDINIYISGAAHPVTHSRTLTYDLEAGHDVALADLFLANSHYLDLIAAYCSAELQKRPIAFDPSVSGVQPTADNYVNWNVTADGLVITFDEYQVAAYAAGPQEVVVPYSELTTAIDPGGPLAQFK
jgi:hypothetical protein